MATNKKKQERRQRKNEQQAKERRKLKENTPSSQPVSKKDKSGMKDSGGNSIPSEKQRRENEHKETKNDKKKKAVKANVNARRYSGNTVGSERAKRKVRYVLDDKAKRWLIKIGAVVIAVIVAIILGVNLATMLSQPTKKETIDDSKVISLTGMTREGKTLIEDTGKYDGFMKTENGHSLYSVYDTDLTEKDASILNERSQYPTEGIFPYNQEVALRKELPETTNSLAPQQDTVVGGVSY